MNLSQETIEELRQIIKEDYGVELTLAQATEIANNLVGYFDLLAKIPFKDIQKNENDNNQRSNNTIHFFVFENMI